MGKPSIFSQEYNRRMKMRRIKMGFFIFALIVGCAAFLSRGFMKGWLQSNIKTLSVKQMDVKSLLSHGEKKENEPQEQVNDKPTAEPVVKPAEKTEEIVMEEKTYDIKLSEDRIIKIMYEERAEGKVLKGISSEGVYFNISPSGKKIVILDSKTQDMILADAEGNSSDITLKQYTSSRGEVYLKNQYLRNHPGYIWSESPQFLDDDKIAFISQVPYFGRDTKYVWTINLKANPSSFWGRFKHFEELAGRELRFEELTDNGIVVDMDGTKVILNSNNEIKK